MNRAILKSFLFFVLLFLFSFSSFSQTVVIFEENFENEVSAWNFSNDISNITNWTQNTELFQSGGACANNSYSISNENILITTETIDLSLISDPILTFWQIAKTETTMDKCFVEISLDGGTTFYQLPGSTYQGTANYSDSKKYFDESSYDASVWGGNIAYIPTNDWWKKETFNLNPFTSENNVKFRFRLSSDEYFNRAGWFIDNIEIKGTPSNNITSYIENVEGNVSETISSVLNSAPGQVVFEFKLTDAGGDVVSTIIDKLTIKQGITNDFEDWTIAIAGATLSGPDLVDYEGYITAEQIEFSGDNIIEISDGNSEIYQLKIWLKENNLGGSETDNFDFKLSGANIINDPTGSFFQSNSTATTGNTVNKLSVEATDLVFVQQPTNTPINTNMIPAVKVAGTDKFGNIDYGFNGNTIFLSSTGSMIGDPLQEVTENGVATFSLVKHGAIGENFQLTATYQDWDTTSIYFNIIDNLCNIVTNPPSENGELKMCMGQNVVTLTGTYEGMGTPTYFWELGDGHSATGQSVTQAYDGTYGYNVKLIVETNTNYCESELKIMVSPGPIIENIPPDISFCYGQSYDLSAGAEGSLFEVSDFDGAGISVLSLADTTYLPDTETDHTVYTTTLTYTQFSPDAVLTDADFLTVYANMEHSFFGDLEIEISCPNGSRVHMQNGYYGEPSFNQSNYMGEPVDEFNDAIPGVGYEYRWTENNPQYGQMNSMSCPSYSYIDVTGVSRSNEYFPAGSYPPYDSFGPLVGCPLNGNWTIIVTDSWGIDDGFIFEWGLELDPSLMPSNWNYETNILSYSWDGPGEITGTGANVTVTPPEPGDNVYTLTVRDDFGCSTLQDLHIDVTDGIPYEIEDVTICESSITIDAGEGFESYEWKDILGVTIGTERTIEISESGTYTVNVFDGECGGHDEFEVVIGAFDYNAPPDPEPYCENPGLQIDAGAGFNSYQWFLNGEEVSTNRKYTPEESGNYTIKVKNQLGCYSQDDINVTIFSNPDLTVTVSDEDNAICYGEGISITVTDTEEYELGITFPEGIQNGVEFYPADSENYIIEGVFVIDENKNCTAMISVPITVNQLPEIQVDDAFSCGTTAILEAEAGFETYNWLNPSGNQISTTQTAVAETEGTYTIEVFDGNCYNTDEAVVTLGSYTYSAPEAPETFCIGEIVPIDAGEGYINYEWTLNSENVGNSQILQVSEAGTYIITVQITEECSLSDQVVVTTFELPEIEVLSSDDDFELCNGEGITLNYTGSDNVTWNNGITNNVEFYPEITQIYTVTVNDGNCDNSQDFEITVNQLPNIDIEDNGFCENTNVTINAGSYVSYTWYFNEAIIGTSQNITIDQAGDYSITVVDNNGCENTDEFAIVESAAPELSIENQEVCEGIAYVFDAGENMSDYNWYNSSGQNIGNSQTIQLFAAGSYSVEIENQYGCTNSDEFTLTVNQLPDAFAGNDIEICQGETVTLLATGGDTYEWNNGAVQNQPFIPSETTTFTVTVYDSNNCFASDDLTVSVYENPELNVENQVTICEGELANLDAGSGFSIYDWSSGENSQIISTDDAGTYTVTVYNNHACSSSAEIELFVNPLPSLNEIFTSNIDQITIDAESSTNLYYSIDNGLTFVEDSIFSQLMPGNFDIVIKDENNCMLKVLYILDISDIFIPKFFTPNFDGTNDTWEIGGIRAYPEAEIEIYDRFGKLLTKYNGSQTGWDGTYRGKDLASDSYWYVIDLHHDEKIYSGFVTIKR